MSAPAAPERELKQTRRELSRARRELTAALATADYLRRQLDSNRPAARAVTLRGLARELNIPAQVVSRFMGAGRRESEAELVRARLIPWLVSRNTGACAKCLQGLSDDALAEQLRKSGLYAPQPRAR